MQNPLRNIPSVNELLESPPLDQLVDRVSHNVVVNGIRSFLDNLRDEVRTSSGDWHLPSATHLAQRIADWILDQDQPPLRPVINATGILLHTGLGRAPLPAEALDEVAAIGRGYASVEVDLHSGIRSQRVLAVEKLLRQLTGAEAACVVNNNAAATLLTLTALAYDREVIVSRGQLIEIGGSFRLPDVMSSSGARLREVGTTNKTRIGDYRAALGDETAALLRVHTSNYRVVGFHEEASLDELVALGREAKLPVVDDIGSGALLDFSRYGICDEPVAAESIRAGADVVLFSGDKLLGGPQCGIIVGRRAIVATIAKHPMMRAMRLDKMMLAALAATLRLYRDADVAEQRIPLLALLSTSMENLKDRAERIAQQLAAHPQIAASEVVQSVTYLGGGSVPAQEIGTWCVSLAPQKASVEELAFQLRAGTPSVYGRVQRDRLWLDLRAVFPSQDRELIQAAGQAAERSEEKRPG